MTRVEQPNYWSCLPASFSMVLGIDLGTIISNIGHDGSLVLFPDTPEPQCRQGFHIQELIDVADQFGFGITHFQIFPQMLHGEHHRDVYRTTFALSRFESLLEQSSGVITGLNDAGRYHAVAWDKESKRLFDPAKKPKTRLEDMRMESFWSCWHKH